MRTTTATEVVSGACLAPWGPAAAGLPGAAEVPLPPLSGFVTSRFNPLVAEVVRRCLAGHDVAGERTTMLLGSVVGDATTADVAARALARGNAHNPLLFFQSVPSSVLGALARDYGITGPVTCLSARERLAGLLLDAAALLLADPGIDRVLLVGVELAQRRRARQVFAELADGGADIRPPDGDVAVALLITAPVVTPLADPTLARLGHLAPLAALCPPQPQDGA